MYYSPDPSLEAEIARLGDLGLSELRNLWAERLGPVAEYLRIRLSSGSFKGYHSYQSVRPRPRNGLIQRGTSSICVMPSTR